MSRFVEASDRFWEWVTRQIIRPRVLVALAVVFAGIMAASWFANEPAHRLGRSIGPAYGVVMFLTCAWLSWSLGTGVED